MDTIILKMTLCLGNTAFKNE